MGTAPGEGASKVDQIGPPPPPKKNKNLEMPLKCRSGSRRFHTQCVGPSFGRGF